MKSMSLYRRYLLLLGCFVFAIQVACTQAPGDRPHTLDTKFDQKVSQSIDFTVPLIGVEELQKNRDKVYLFDTREKEEFTISHIPGAQYLGYDDFDARRLGDVPKDAKIVVYCSIGYRSEKIGERLQKMGYSNVHNLYGSLFDWVNRGNEVVDQEDKVTQKVHTYNRNWSKWVNDGAAEKVW